MKTNVPPTEALRWMMRQGQALRRMGFNPKEDQEVMEQLCREYRELFDRDLAADLAPIPPKERES